MTVRRKIKEKYEDCDITTPPGTFSPCLPVPFPLLGASYKRMILTVSLLDTPLKRFLCHPPRLQEEGAWVEGSRGLCGSPQCPSSPWWWPTDVDHIEEEDPATLPASFSLAPQSCNWLRKVLLLPTFG